MRLFVAIELLGPAMEAVLAASRELARVVQGQGLRFVKPEKMHLTLAFLGNVEDSSVESLKAALYQVHCSRPFVLTTAGIGAFPEIRRPKVIWVGLEGETSEAGQLATQVANAASPFAPERDRKAFAPHVTLARINPGSPRIGRAFEAAQIRVARADLAVTEISLVNSRPDGSYEAIQKIKLTG